MSFWLSPSRVSPGTLATSADPFPRAAHGHSVLLVEDEADVRNIAAVTLRRLGYRVHAAEDGAAALALAREESKLDLLLSDIVLPGGMNGNQLADEVRKLHAAVRLVFVSGYSDRTLRERGELPRGVRLILKPFDIHQLATALNEALRSA